MNNNCGYMWIHVDQCAMFFQHLMLPTWFIDVQSAAMNQIDIDEMSMSPRGSKKTCAVAARHVRQWPSMGSWGGRRRNPKGAEHVWRIDITCNICIYGYMYNHVYCTCIYNYIYIYIIYIFMCVWIVNDDLSCERLVVVIGILWSAQTEYPRQRSRMWATLESMWNPNCESSCIIGIYWRRVRKNVFFILEFLNLPMVLTHVAGKEDLSRKIKHTSFQFSPIPIVVMTQIQQLHWQETRDSRPDAASSCLLSGNEMTWTRTWEKERVLSICI